MSAPRLCRRWPVPPSRSRPRRAAMANVESLVFDLLVRDRASEGLSKVGRTAESAAKDTDALTRRLNELSRKSVEARVRLAGDKEALAALDKMDARLITL